MPAVQAVTKPKFVKRPLVAKPFAVEDIARVRTAVDVFLPGDGVTREIRASEKIKFALDGSEDEWLTITSYGGTDQRTGMPENIQTCRIHTQYCVFEMRPEPAMVAAKSDA